jgi:hypothetical protein
VPRLFALDHNFPDPIVAVLAEYQSDATLVRIDQIDPRMPDLDDWQLLLALHRHAVPGDGLITTDSSILNQGPELATLIQTKLTLVVAMASGHDPVKASGLLFAYLSGICTRTSPDAPQHRWRFRVVPFLSSLRSSSLTTLPLPFICDEGVRVVKDRNGTRDDREGVCEARVAVDLVADVDRVVLAVGADAPGSEEPAPTGHAVPAQRPPGRSACARRLGSPPRGAVDVVEVDVEVVSDVGGKFDDRSIVSSVLGLAPAPREGRPDGAVTLPAGGRGDV